MCIEFRKGYYLASLTAVAAYYLCDRVGTNKWIGALLQGQAYLLQKEKRKNDTGYCGGRLWETGF
jgi:hypothetical protein